MSVESIETSRLLLVPMTPAFLRASLEGNVPQAERELQVSLPTEWPEEHAPVLALRLKQLESDLALQPWLLRAMILRNSGTMVGHIGFHTAPGPEYLQQFSPGGVEFGFSVFPPFRRQGYAREAAQALMHWARTTQGVTQFVMSIRPDNPASQGLAAQFGFVRVGSHLDEVDGMEDVLELRVGPPEIAGRLAEQLDYYRARAQEYDQWWLREGRYDRGPSLNAQWFAEAATVRTALELFRPAGRILELACGTGIWSERLLPFAAEFTALDGSAEMLAVNAARLRSARVRYVEADLFRWQPSGPFDVVFFGFWLSHVPPERFTEFWQLVGSCLAPGGRVFFVDSRRELTSTAINHQLPAVDATVHRRRLNDGREFQVYKVFYDPAALRRRLEELGWQFEIHQTDHYFLYGEGAFAAS